MITSGITMYRSTGSRLYLPIFLSHLSKAYAELGQFDQAWRYIGEAMAAVETTNERWYEAEIHRVAGEIALKLPQLAPSQKRRKTYFERALHVARVQQAKSWELRGWRRAWRALPRSRHAGESLRSSRSSLWVVHRGLRNARP